STTPVSPMTRRPTRTSPFTLPSICNSPLPLMLPSKRMSEASRDEALPDWAGAPAGAAAARLAAPGEVRSGRSGIGTGAGWGRVLALLNMVSGSHETCGVLGTAVHPHFVMQMHAGGPAGGAHAADAMAD